MQKRRILSWAVIVTIVVLGTICYVPAALFFPHAAVVGDITVYAEAPIDPRIAEILANAETRVASSALATPLGPRAVYLTQGGWRWVLLTLPTSHGAFALTRPFSKNIVVNRSSIADDRVENASGHRTLTGTIAHETTHLLINRRYTGIEARLFASWRVEGYCDHVAGESSLSPDEAARLHAEGASTPALAYYDARKRIEAEAAAGATVDQLLRGD